MTLPQDTVYSNLSVSDIEDSLEKEICHTQAMWAQIAAE